MTHLTISRTTARRYLLGRQGLWPGRRWQGAAGTAQALRYCEAVQIDPLCVVARNHDLTLHSRVIDYQPEQLDQLLYQAREFFDYGGAIFIYPMDELPYWRVAMQRKGQEPRWAEFAQQRPDLLKEVRNQLRQRGPLGNRDFDGRPKGDNYRSGKDTGLAMYCLWLRGELMTHSRRNFDRLYDFRDNVAPAQFNRKATVTQAEDFFARKALAFRGLSPVKAFADSLWRFVERRVTRDEAQRRLNRLIDAGAVMAVNVEGWQEPLYLLAEDAPLLTTLEADQVPDGWRPLDTTTADEVNFLAPLDIVSARGRAKVWFDFEYIWEVYKPAHQRRWGYYTLPILYGDRLVARFDPKLDRATSTLIVNGLWLEDAALAENAEFTGAFARGLDRFRRFLKADHIDLSAVLRAVNRNEVGQLRMLQNLAKGAI
ncbi:MAG TPA: crosslink repair DNA glycosylase YcaQ family protein [Anaerolineae bacterium]|nr:crosslink repair DNA glycosylase YcaQ family protein [Anaerolineae bacterium]